VKFRGLSLSVYCASIFQIISEPSTLPMLCSTAAAAQEI